jgi:N-acetylneuraminate synthase
MSSYIIAEAGVNHNGSLDLARKLVDVAAEAGADAVKFQTFRAEALASAAAEKAAYQQATTGGGSQVDMLRALEMAPADYQALRTHCQERGITFLSTPFDEQSVDLLVEGLQVPRIKVPSGEITNGPLLLHIAQTALPVILSTGMATLGEVEDALGVLAFGFLGGVEPSSRSDFGQALASEEGREALRDRVTLLHCTTEYPAPFEEINLRAMDTLRQAFDLPVGLSDHSMGTAVPVAAVARGAVLVEKHFTLDRSMEGPDHRASLEPDELDRMIREIRQVEQALGTARKGPTPSEIQNRPIARESLVAARPIEQGDRFTRENLTTKRPGDGMSPMAYWTLLGRTATRSYALDDRIDETSAS